MSIDLYLDVLKMPFDAYAIHDFMCKITERAVKFIASVFSEFRQTCVVPDFQAP